MPVLFLLTMLGSFAFALRRWLRGGRAPRLGPYYAALEASHGPDPSRPMWSMLAASVPPPSDREALKRNVLRLASAAPPVPRKDLVEAVEALEAVNPTRDPADSPLVSGCWALLFAGAVSDEAEAERARREGPVGGTISPRPAERQKPEAPEGRPLGRTLSNLKVGLATTKGNWQDIDAVNGKVRNRADIDLFWGSAPLAFCIDGSCQKVPSEQTDNESKRLAVVFESVKLGLGRGGPKGDLPEGTLSIPLGWLNDGKGPQGWVETTYVDEDVRIGRGDKGTIFVTARVK